MWQFATQDDTDEAVPGDDSGPDRPGNLLYLRIAGRLSVVLSRDTAWELQEDEAPYKESTDAAKRRGKAAKLLPHRYVELKHDLISPSAAAVQPESDVVFLSHDTSPSYLKEMRRFYGTQLDAIQNVMFEGDSWDDRDECLELMGFLKKVCTIYVWLESERFAGNIDRVTEEDYLAMVRKFKARDEVNLKGRNVMVEYIDYKGNVHGGFRANADRPPRPASQPRQRRQRPSSGRESKKV